MTTQKPVYMPMELILNKKGVCVFLTRLRFLKKSVLKLLYRTVYNEVWYNLKYRINLTLKPEANNLQMQFSQNISSAESACTQLWTNWHDPNTVQCVCLLCWHAVFNIWHQSVTTILCRYQIFFQVFVHRKAFSYLCDCNCWCRQHDNCYKILWV